jgi:hypothetical protein
MAKVREQFTGTMTIVLGRGYKHQMPAYGIDDRVNLRGQSSSTAR